MIKHSSAETLNTCKLELNHKQDKFKPELKSGFERTELKQGEKSVIRQKQMEFRVGAGRKSSWGSVSMSTYQAFLYVPSA